MSDVEAARNAALDCITWRGGNVRRFDAELHRAADAWEAAHPDEPTVNMWWLQGWLDACHLT